MRFIEDEALDVVLNSAAGRPATLLTLVDNLAESVSRGNVSVTPEQARNAVDTFTKRLELEQKYLWTPTKP